VNTPSRLDKETFMRKVLSIAVVIGAAFVLALPARGRAEEPRLLSRLPAVHALPVSPSPPAKERAAVRAETLVSRGEARAEWVRGR